MALRLTVFGPGHPFRGGIARATTAMVEALVDDGHNVEFLTPRRQYPGWLYPGATDRDPEACPPLDVATAVLDPFDPMGWPTVRRLARDHRADAWILPYWTWAWAGLWWYLLGSPDRPPALSVVHNPMDHDTRWVQRSAARRTLGRCQGLFTHARSMARDLERDYPSVPVGHHRLPAVGSPVAPDRTAARAELDLPADRRVALFLGLIRPYKGVDVLVEAAAGLSPDSDWQILIAGEPWRDLGENLERQVEALGLADRVRLDLRWIPEDRVATLLAAADVLVLPYRRGSQSAVAPMALQHGLPVLSTAVGGVPEVVVDGVNGVVVPPGDPAAITAALEELDRRRLEELAEGARRSSDELTWAGYVRAMVELLTESVLDGATNKSS
jgi:glycosyltransferase involved in cell wall biosynthesis